jgi:hypothetical protein
MAAAKVAKAAESGRFEDTVGRGRVFFMRTALINIATASQSSMY